jgi:hypothetical protein
VHLVPPFFLPLQALSRLCLCVSHQKDKDRASGVVVVVFFRNFVCNILLTIPA